MERLTKVGQVKLKDSRFGAAENIGIGFEKLDRGAFEPEKAYDKVAALGIKWVRIQSGWARTERVKGVYDFAWLDDIVDNLVSRGLEPWICFCYGNPVYTQFAEKYYGAVGCPPIETEEERIGWRNYVDATVRHFKGRVTWFEVWNEPDCPYSWKHSENGGVSAPKAKEYAHFCIDTADTVHNADPDAKVIGFALGHSYRIINAESMHYFAEAMQEGVADHVDAISFHIYSCDDTMRPYCIDMLRSIIDVYNPNIELIQGEAGAQSRSDGAGAMRGYAWSEEKQTKYMLRGMLHDLAKSVKFSSYFSTMDMVEALNGLTSDKQSYLDYGYFGVLRADFNEDGIATGDYTPKKSYYALGTLSAVFRGDFKPASLPLRRIVKFCRRYGGEDCNDKTITSYGFKRPDGSALFVYWNALPILTNTYEGSVSYDVVLPEGTKIQLLDMATGELYEMPESMVIHHENGIVELLNIPISDMPKALVFGDFIKE